MNQPYVPQLTNLNIIISYAIKGSHNKETKLSTFITPFSVV